MVHPTTTTPIQVEGLGIRFVRNRKRRIRLKDLMLGRTREIDTFWALRDVSFTVGRGETVGVVGANGSGKSTLLKLMAGVLIPDEGHVTMTGHVAPLLELSSGFARDLTARDNIYLSGVIHGLSRDSIEERLDAIVEFAEIGEFLDTPVRHFSSGMKARLGFALITQLDHPIMLIDEALAVGDARFRRKCLTTIEEMHEDRTVLIVSHNNRHIERLCDRVLLLERGNLVADGPTAEVLPRYASGGDD